MNEKQIIQQIIDLKEDEIDEFIEKRIEELERTATEDREEISPFAVMRSRHMGVRENPEVMGYIPARIHIAKSGMDISSFVLDDNSFYKTIISYIKNEKPGDRINNNYMMSMVQRTIVNYFGVNANEISRNALYDSKMDIENDDCTLSISDFKNNNTGMCVERSAVAQNILSFLGYNPMMIFGYASNQKDGINVGHAYNCIIRDGKGLVIDFSNPLFKDGKVFKPAIFPINQKNLQAFMKSTGQIEVEHKDLYHENGIEKEDATTWVYSSEQIDPKYFEKSKKSIITPSDIVNNTSNMGLQEINSVTQESRAVTISKSEKKDGQTHDEE